MATSVICLGHWINSEGLHPTVDKIQNLQKGISWRWETNYSLVFQQVKESLQTNCVLVHYDPKKEPILTCYASQYGKGAVLSNTMLNGNEKPVAYAS